MELPNMKYADKLTKGKQVRFRGLNHTIGARDGEIWDMKNMTGDHAPVLSTRARRMLYKTLEKPGGLYAWEGLAWVDGTGFYYKGEWKGTVSEGLKHFGSLGSKIVILPDKCYYDVASDTFGSMESMWEGETLTFTNGKLYGVHADANTIQAEGVSWAEYFREGDAVTIAGCTVHPENNQTAIIREIDGDKLYFYENIFSIGENGYAETGSMRIARTVPDLISVCENENRLWGRTEDTVFSSALGDIFNWNLYDGIDSDAYAVTPGSGGNLTGCISYRGYPIFMKVEHIYKVYGSVPSDFQLMGSASLGLADGSGGSLAVAGEVLYYLGRNGIMAYSGGIPQSVADAFGMDRFRNAVGGSDGLKYYVSMEDESGTAWLYVYDTQKKMWHKEDQTRVTHFASWNGNLYFLNDKGEIWITGNIQDPPDGVQEEEEFEFMVEFSDFTDDDPNKKGVGKLQMRIELDPEAELEVLVQFDSDEVWRSVKSIVSSDPKRSFVLPVVPRRCDHYRVRLQGWGGCRVYSMTREYFSGSELKSSTRRN